jgi:hypothetical protein
MLTKSFRLSELTRSSALDEYNKQHDAKIRNNPDSQSLKNLKYLCENYLQPLRDDWGPITINSGYRNEFVNFLVGGSENSFHRLGLAVDIKCNSWVEGFMFCSFFHRRFLSSGLGYHELFLSYRRSNKSIWVHLAVPQKGLQNIAFMKCSFITY